jgi:hypothetical protein
MWTFEPHVATKIYDDMLRATKVQVVLGERLDLKNGVVKNGARIAKIVTESGREFAGKMFIDATYEGDLMAKAGVKYMVGREANERFDETLNGSQRVGTGYLHDQNQGKGMLSVKWTPDIPETGDYEIVLHFPPNANRATNTPVTIAVSGHEPKTVRVNERERSGAAPLGRFSLKAGKSLTIALSNKDTEGHVVADGVQLLKAK